MNIKNSRKIEKDKFFYVIGCLFFLVPLFFIDYVNSFIRLILIGTILMGCLVILKNNYYIKISSTYVLFGILGVWILISAIEHEYAYEMAFMYLILFVELIFLILNRGDSNIIIFIIELFGLFHTICTLLIQILPVSITNTILMSILNERYWSNYNWRIVQGYNCGITLQPGENAMYIMLFFVVMFSKWMVSGKWKNMIGMIIAYIATITTGKRTPALLLLLISVLIYLFIKNKKFKKSHFLIGIISIFCIIFILFWLVRRTTVLDALSKKMQVVSNYNDISSGRFQIWKDAWTAFSRHIIVGNGIKSTYLKYQLDVHNNYLQFLSELGLIGFVLLLSFIINILKVCFTKLKQIKKLNLDADKTISQLFSIYLIFYLVLYAFIGNPFVDYIPLQILVLTSSILLTNYNNGNEKMYL